MGFYLKKLNMSYTLILGITSTPWLVTDFCPMTTLLLCGANMRRFDDGKSALTADAPANFSSRMCLVIDVRLLFNIRAGRSSLNMLCAYGWQKSNKEILKC